MHGSTPARAPEARGVRGSLVTGADPHHKTSASDDPAKRVEREESISLAFLVLLEQLQPFERAVFLLREVFAYEFAEIAAMLERVKRPVAAPSAGRSNICARIGHASLPLPKHTGNCSPAISRRCRTGEMTTLTDLLAEEVTLWADAGGKLKQAALRPIRRA